VNVLRLLKFWVRSETRPTPPEQARPEAGKDGLPGSPAPDDPVVADERTRIEDLRSVAKWQLAALGAVATVAFTGVAISRVPNAADTSTGGWLTLMVATAGAGITLVSVVMTIRLVGLVLAPQYESLEDQLRSTRRRKGQQWYDQPTLYLPFPQITTLQVFLETRTAAYTRYAVLAGSDRRTPAQDAELAALNLAINTYYTPVSLRLHWRNRRELVARRARSALTGLAVWGSAAGLGVVAFLGANAYRQTMPVQAFVFPAYGVWRPLGARSPAWTPEALGAELGGTCPLAVAGTRNDGIQVLVLRESPGDGTFDIVVTEPSCRPRLFTTARDTVTAARPVTLRDSP